MLKILREKLIALGRGEEGVAMVVTLGIFMFLYVACASVYAVGWAVKEKMHLQAACDAAAYSAAIVQADTFSRIATINRAMSWTYQQMTRRQMDYIVWQWLEEVVEHHARDRKNAEDYAYAHNHDLSGGKCQNPGQKCYAWGHGYWIGRKGEKDIYLNGKGPYSQEEIRGWCRNDFPSHLFSCRESFYSRSATLSGLGNQIDDDLLNIYHMSEAVEDLARGLPKRVDTATSAILAANVPNYMTGGDCQYFIRQESDPYSTYFQKFSNDSYHEQIFLSYDDNEVKEQSEIFGAGIDTWFVRGSGSKQDSAGKGIHRSFNHALTVDENPLKATWTWWATGWTCKTINGVHAAIPTSWAGRNDCSHSVDHSRYGGDLTHCRCRRKGNSPSMKSESDPYKEVWRTLIGGGRQFIRFESAGLRVHHRDMGALCLADSLSHGSNLEYDNAQVGRYDNRFRSRLRVRENGRLVEKDIYARPLKLDSPYFGHAGTITVGLARRNENPWFSVLGPVGGGIYSAFSPVSNSWSFCFASAKAGYKLYHVPKDYYIDAHRGEEDSTVRRDDWEERYNGNVRVYNGPRDYCVDWKPDGSRFQDWITPYKRDKDGNYVYKNGKRVKENYTIVYFTNPTELRPSWRQSWNLVQDDWDAVMVPVRRGLSKAYEKEEYSLREWWRKRLQDYARNKWQTIPYRFYPIWENDPTAGSFVSHFTGGSWKALSGSGTPNTMVPAGPRIGNSGDSLNGRLAGQLWEDHWERGVPPPQATGTSLWNIGTPGQGLNWNRIGDEMYH